MSTVGKTVGDFFKNLIQEHPVIAIGTGGSIVAGSIIAANSDFVMKKKILNIIATIENKIQNINNALAVLEKLTKNYQYDKEQLRDYEKEDPLFPDEVYIEPEDQENINNQTLDNMILFLKSLKDKSNIDPHSIISDIKNNILINCKFIKNQIQEISENINNIPDLLENNTREELKQQLQIVNQKNIEINKIESIVSSSLSITKKMFNKNRR